VSEFLLRTKLAIDECEQHLTKCGVLGSPVEAYLSQYVLIVMCADVQQEILRLTELKAAPLTPEFQSFTVASAKRLLRSVEKGEIASYLACFGQDVKDALNDAVDARDVTTYNNAVSARHDVAHRQGTRITFDEAKKAVGAATRILAEVARAMQVTLP
jgi:hypothetical protein